MPRRINRMRGAVLLLWGLRLLTLQRVAGQKKRIGFAENLLMVVATGFNKYLLQNNPQLPFP